MKKILLPLVTITAVFFAQAQIPTNGLTDQWKLNGNLVNNVNATNPLRGTPYVLCEDENLDPVIFEAYTTNYHVAGPTPADSTGYKIGLFLFPGFVICGNPAGPPQVTIGTRHSALETIGNFAFGDQARTISLWAKRPRAANPNVDDLLFAVGGTGNFELFGVLTYLDTVYLVNRGEMAKGTITADTLWHNYTATYSNDTFRLFFDGAEVAASLAANTQTAASPIYFGLNQGDIQIDNILVYNRAVTAQEALAIFENEEVSTSMAKPKKDDLSFVVYPNPANNLITINSNNTIGGYTITNSLGKVVASQTTTNINTTIDISHLQAGVYFISAGGNTTKFSKQQ